MYVLFGCKTWTCQHSAHKYALRKTIFFHCVYARELSLWELRWYKIAKSILRTRPHAKRWDTEILNTNTHNRSGQRKRWWLQVCRAYSCLQGEEIWSWQRTAHVSRVLYFCVHMKCRRKVASFERFRMANIAARHVKRRCGTWTNKIFPHSMSWTPTRHWYIFPDFDWTNKLGNARSRWRPAQCGKANTGRECCGRYGRSCENNRS